MIASLTVLAGLLASASAKKCRDFMVPVDIMARQGTYNVPNITSNSDVTSFFANFTSIANGTNYTAEALTGYHTVTGTYNISARFCTPDDVATSTIPVVQVLTHGIGFDKSYWSLPASNGHNYSYVDVAVDMYGYCTLSYDRFGIGNSSHADGVDVVQAPAEVSALYQLNSMLRNGTLPGVAPAFNESNTIANIGHSFGSQQTYMLSAMYPDITDAIVLTGFSFNGSGALPTVASFNAKIARQNQPLRFGSTSAAAAVALEHQLLAQSNTTTSPTELLMALSALNLTLAEVTDIIRTTELWNFVAGSTMEPYPEPLDYDTTYITWSDAGANQYSFLYPPGIDENIIYFAEANKQPFTFGEILTLGGIPAVSPFEGPVHIVTGRQDSIYCAGDCLATGNPNVTSILDQMAGFFNRSMNFTTSVPADTGHAINLHYSAPAVFKEIQLFLMENDLIPM